MISGIIQLPTMTTGYFVGHLYKSLFTIQYGRNDNEKKNKQKHSQQTITHYDSDITCPEISSDDEQAGHSANQS